MSEREQMERVGRGKQASWLLGLLSFACLLFYSSILISDQVKCRKTITAIMHRTPNMPDLLCQQRFPWRVPLNLHSDLVRQLLPTLGRWDLGEEAKRHMPVVPLHLWSLILVIVIFIWFIFTELVFFFFFNLLFLSPKINFGGLAKSMMYLLETDFWTVPTHPQPLTLLGSRVNVCISFYIL